MKYSDLVASTQEKIDADVDFQNSLANLSDDEKATTVSAKQEELINTELGALEDKATKSAEIAQNQKIRAEKAEAEAKKPKVTEPKSETLSKRDQILEARALNELHEDDIDEVVAIADAKKITLSEAVKSPYVKAFLKERADERKTAATVNTGSGKRTNQKSESESLVKKAENYQLAPDEMKSAAAAVINEIFGKK